MVLRVQFQQSNKDATVSHSNSQHNLEEECNDVDKEWTIITVNDHQNNANQSQNVHGESKDKVLIKLRDNTKRLS